MDELESSNVPKVKLSRMNPDSKSAAAAPLILVVSPELKQTNPTFRVSLDNLIAANTAKRTSSPELKPVIHPLALKTNLSSSRETLVVTDTDKTASISRVSSFTNAKVNSVVNNLSSSSAIPLGAASGSLGKASRSTTFSPPRVRTEIAEEFEVNATAAETKESKKDFQDNKLFHEMVESTAKILPKKSIFNSKVLSCIVILCNINLGVGLLSFPYVFAVCGTIGGTLILIISAILTLYSIQILIDCSEISFYHRTVPRNDIASYNYLAMIAFPNSKLMRWLCDVSNVAFGIGNATCCLVAIGDCIPAILSMIFGVDLTQVRLNPGTAVGVVFSREFCMLVFAIVMSPTAVKGSLGSMKYFSVIAICLAIYLTAAVVGYSSSNAVTNQVIPGIESFLFSNKLFAVLPICLVSYSVHLNVFGVYHELRPLGPERFDVVIYSVIFISTFFYVLIGLGGYYTFGSGTLGNVLNNYHSAYWVTLARVAASLLSAMSFPLQINPCLSSLNALIVDVYNLVPQRFRRNFGVRPHPSTSPNSPSLDMEGFGEELEMQHNQEGELSGDEENRSNADNNGSNEDFNPTQNQLQRGTGDSSSHAHQLQEVNKMLGSRKFWVAMFALSVSYLIASLVDQLDVVFQYVGAIAGTMICFIFPAFFSLRIFERDSIQSNSIFIGLKKRSAAILLGVIGVFMEEQRKEKILLPKLPPVSSLLLEIGAATEEGGHSNTLQHEGESVTSKEQQHQQLPQLLFKQHQHPAFPANLVPSIPTPLPPHPYYRPQFYEEVYSRATAAASSPSYEELNHLRDGFRNQELQHPQTLPHASSYRHHSLDQFMALQHQQHPPHPPPPPQEEVVIDLTNEDANGDNSNNQLAHCSHSQTSQIANDDESDDHIVISSAHQPPLKRSREDEEQLPQAYQQRLEQQQQYYQNQQEYYQQQQQQQRQVELLPRPQTHRQVHEEFIYLGYIGTRIINLDFDIFQRRVIGKQSQIHFSSYTRSLNVFDFEARTFIDGHLGESFGILDQDMASHLSPLIGSIRLQVIVPDQKLQARSFARIDLKIFAQPSQFTRIKLHLSACDVVLVPSTADYGGGRGVGGRGSSGGNTPVEKSQEETRKFIESFYNSLTSPEDFPETEPNDRLVTKLYRHQKQALYFMLEREREIKFVAYKNSKTKGAMTAEDMSLWRREDNEEIKHVITSDIWESSSAVQEESDNDSEAEGLSPRKRKNKPNASRGGILADDMGLGKTIEVIALILHLKTDMQPKRSGGKGKSSATAVEISDMEVVDLTGDRPVVTAGIKEEHVGSNPDDNQVSASSATSSNQKLAENSSETMMLDDDEDVAMNVTANAAGVGGDDVVDNINDAIFDKINNSSNNVGGGGGDVGDDDDDDIIIIEHVKPASTPSASSSTNNDIQITSAAINPDAKSASRPPILPPPAKNMMEKLKNLFGGNTQLVQSGYFNKSVKTELPLSNPDIKLIKSKATLIVCPLSTVSNWEDQFSSHIKKDSIKLYVYHGADRTTKGKELAKFDIVLTTYNILSLEYSRVQRSEKASSLLHSIRWHRIVLDEAHIIKDSNTAQSKSACSLPSSRRWCLSGTPVQNRLEDLYSLVKFLRLDPFSNKHVWSYFFKNVSSKGNELSVSRLQTLMRSITLRRTKNSKIEGKPILSLPEKYQTIRKVQLSQTELQVYQSVEARAQAIFDSGSVFSNYVNLLELMLRLRQACVHPFLTKIDLDKLASSSEPQPLSAARVALLFSMLQDAGDDSCCSCSRLVADKETSESSNNLVTAAVSKCGHMFCIDCTSNIFGQHTKIYCPICKTVLSVEDVVEVNRLEEDGEKEVVDVAPAAVIGTSRPSKNTTTAASRRSSTSDTEESNSGESDDDYKDKAETTRADGSWGGGSCGSSCSGGVKGKGAVKGKNFKQEVILSKSKEDSMSSKIQALLDDLGFVRQSCLDNNSPQEKSVIFSQWTQVLDLIEKPLQRAGYKFVRLDGRMRRADRTTSLTRFKEEELVTILLLSIKAGGVGLNLTSASRVYIMEPYWNPAVEQQAVDRVHRLGQTQAVHVTRYLVPNSIEDRMVAMQRRKMRLVSLTFNEDESSGSGGGSGSGKGKRKAGGERNAQNEARLQNMRMMLLGPTAAKEVIEID